MDDDVRRLLIATGASAAVGVGVGIAMMQVYPTALAPQLSRLAALLIIVFGVGAAELAERISGVFGWILLVPTAAFALCYALVGLIGGVWSLPPLDHPAWFILVVLAVLYFGAAGVRIYFTKT